MWIVCACTKYYCKLWRGGIGNPQRVYDGHISTGMVGTNADRCSSAKLSHPGGREWVTVIRGINSQGWTIPLCIIVASLPTTYRATATDRKQPAVQRSQG